MAEEFSICFSCSLLPFLHLSTFCIYVWSGWYPIPIRFNIFDMPHEFTVFGFVLVDVSCLGPICPTNIRSSFCLATSFFCVWASLLLPTLTFVTSYHIVSLHQTIRIFGVLCGACISLLVGHIRSRLSRENLETIHKIYKHMLWYHQLVW